MISNPTEKEKCYLDFEQKFKAWRESNPLPTFDHYMGISFEEADNIELFYETFICTFDELFLEIF